MRALVLHGSPNKRFHIEEVGLPELKEGQALIRLLAASLNHRDQYIREGQYEDIRLPCILGSDGCGVVEAVQNPDDSHWVGKEVIINPCSNWGENPKAPSRHLSTLGMPDAGTFAEYVAVDTAKLHRKAAHLSPQQAAALSVCGLTAYRAVVTCGEVRPDMTVLVTGIGGGVAQFARQFTQALGAPLYVTSGSDWKLDRAKELGIAGGINYHTERWERRLKKESGGFDLIIDGAGGDQINTLLFLLKPGGKLVLYGKTLGDPTWLHLYRIFWYQLSLQGTIAGTDEEFKAMLSLVEEKKIVPVVDSVRPFEEIVEAFDLMKEGKQFGKLVVEF